MKGADLGGDEGFVLRWTGKSAGLRQKSAGRRCRGRTAGQIGLSLKLVLAWEYGA